MDIVKTIYLLERLVLLSFCMKIAKQLNGSELILSLEGELNSSNYQELENVIKNDLDNVQSLIFDFTKLVYLSSAGLRVLLIAQKLMNKKGHMLIRHANESIKEIFNITGFYNVLDIED